MGKRQKKLLELIISKCHEGRLIISQDEFISQIGDFCDKDNFQRVLKILESDDYIQVIYTDRHDEPFLYITLLKRALFYKQERKARKKEIFFKISLAVVSAVVTFILGKILYAIFS